MRILYDSTKTAFKTPFGTLTCAEECQLSIHIPVSLKTTAASCAFFADGEAEAAYTAPLKLEAVRGAYEIWSGSFSIDKPALYFYRFNITCATGTFRLFKQGRDTNMEAGELWQLTVTPTEHTVPDWAKGAVFYQIFPDRFCKAGSCDLTGKLTPYEVHEKWDEEVVWQPTPEGVVLNNDFYGGNFRGITSKMDYIASLGVTILYLNPISKSFSSHRYDTGDYKTPDPMLGTMEDFREMCQAAHSHGIRVILDGVYSHTGSNSLYFDKEGAFGGMGAHCSKASPYYSWYNFKHHPDTYECWWNFDTLPTVKKMDPAFVEYIITGEDSVIAHWLNAGADGIRLDVADELPNEFLDLLKKQVRKINPEAIVIGEVWEDASNKEAYGIRKRYFVDGTLDSCMNYPFRTAILDFMKERDDGRALENTVLTIAENYPKQVFLSNMNMLGTHDTPRILTTLVDEFDGSREEKAARHLSQNQWNIARSRLLMASFLQYMLPGSPSLYYADEAGMEGYKDPFNRRTYPWGKEDQELLNHHRQLGRLRKNHPALRTGDIEFFQAADQKIGFARTLDNVKLRIYCNRSNDPWEVPAGKLLYGHNLYNVAPEWLNIAPMGFCITAQEV